MARRREQDPTERYPFGRRRFLQGAAATTAAAFPILRSGAVRAGGGCDLYGTPPSFMGVVPDPASVLGFPIGVDREVTSAESNDYLQAVVGASNRTRGGVVGASVQGRMIRYAVLSHPDNVTVSGLEAVRQANLEIRDPSTRQRRVDELARTTPAFAWIEANVHGSEESGADAALQLLYELADRDDCVVETLLANLVIVVTPVQNPDGRELDQRRNGYGFDLNRDVFARTQVETDDRVELMRTYPPLLLLDHHEFGYYRAFFPPNADPVFHEVPEQVMRQIDDLYGPAMARVPSERLAVLQRRHLRLPRPAVQRHGRLARVQRRGHDPRGVQRLAPREAVRSPARHPVGVPVAGGHEPPSHPASLARRERDGGRAGQGRETRAEQAVLHARPEGAHEGADRAAAALLRARHAPYP